MTKNERFYIGSMVVVSMAFLIIGFFGGIAFCCYC